MKIVSKNLFGRIYLLITKNKIPSPIYNSMLDNYNSKKLAIFLKVCNKIVFKMSRIYCQKNIKILYKIMKMLQ